MIIASILVELYSIKKQKQEEKKKEEIIQISIENWKKPLEE